MTQMKEQEKEFQEHLDNQQKVQRAKNKEHEQQQTK